MILPLLFVPLVYGMSSTPNACAVPPDPKWQTEPARCSWDMDAQYYQCCWSEGDKTYCQECDLGPTGEVLDCKEKEEQTISIQQPPPTTTPPTGGKGIFGSVIPNPSISPNDGGVIEPPITTPTPPTIAPEDSQIDPSISPDDGGVIEPPITTPTPPTIAPEDSQSDEQSGTDGGGGLAPGDNLVPDTGIREQPEVQQPEGPSNEGQDTAGPLT